MKNSNENQIIRFDWAMKRLLRNKANFSVLEGLLTTLLGEKIIIRRLLESESNQEDEYDKYNRVDMLAENSKGELVLIEVQNNNEYAYFQRMLFGTSKLVTEYINRGAVSYTHLRAHETGRNLVCRLLLEKKKKKKTNTISHKQKPTNKQKKKNTDK